MGQQHDDPQHDDNQAEAPTTTASAAPVDPHLVPLEFPYDTAAGVHLTQLRWRRLKVPDLKVISRAAGGDPIEFEAQGVARMCGIIPEDLDGMDMEDYAVLQDRFRSFQGR